MVADGIGLLTRTGGVGENLAGRLGDHRGWLSSRVLGWSPGRGRVESDHSGDGREVDDGAMLAVWCVVGDDCSTASRGDRSNGPGSSARSEISRSDRWRPLGLQSMVVRARFGGVGRRCSLNGGGCFGLNRVDIAGATRCGAAQRAGHRSDAPNGRWTCDARVSWSCDPGEPPVACRPVSDVHVSRFPSVGQLAVEVVAEHCVVDTLRPAAYGQSSAHVHAATQSLLCLTVGSGGAHRLVCSPAKSWAQ